MSYGLNIINDAGNVYLDEDHAILRVRATGAMTFVQKTLGSTTYSWAALPASLVAILEGSNPTQEIYYSFPTGSASTQSPGSNGFIMHHSSFGVGFILRGTAWVGKSLKYAIVDTDYSDVTSSGYGLEVYSAGGAKIFSSNTNLMNPVLTTRGSATFKSVTTSPFTYNVSVSLVPSGKDVYFNGQMFWVWYHRQSIVNYAVWHWWQVYNVTSSTITLLYYNLDEDNFLIGNGNPSVAWDHPSVMWTPLLVGFIS